MVFFEVSVILKGQHGIFPANNFLKWGDDAEQGKKDRRFRHVGLRSFILLFYISANGSLVYPVLYMSISHFLS